MIITAILFMLDLTAFTFWFYKQMTTDISGYWIVIAVPIYFAGGFLSFYAGGVLK